MIRNTRPWASGIYPSLGSVVGQEEANGGSHESVRSARRRSVAWQWLVGRPPVLGLEVVRLLGEFGERPAKRAGDAVGDVPCGVRRPAFDSPDGSLVYVRGVGERFLGESSFAAAQADRAAEGGLWCWALAHAGSLGVDVPDEQEICFRL